eukprot:CAMPEP_0172167490 /NCGR_PEP_ID=MMETSP1050-20130122/9608_1 /TAXON_ID=233186 /ORGANISM="Cryptomonas curvata, Strain CCAP979/52" /LENGTH=186 /DNA_ID=CAMNT_0012838301 /DNA_START=111 /DNA_END=673 /DNA_ORIENTATION=-
MAPRPSALIVDRPPIRVTHQASLEINPSRPSQVVESIVRVKSSESSESNQSESSESSRPSCLESDQSESSDRVVRVEINPSRIDAARTSHQPIWRSREAMGWAVLGRARELSFGWGRRAVASQELEVIRQPEKEESGAGPMASTVREPAAICVRPASVTKYVTRPRPLALLSMSSISDSASHQSMP